MKLDTGNLKLITGGVFLTLLPMLCFEPARAHAEQQLSHAPIFSGLSLRDCAVSSVPLTNRWEYGFLTGNGNVGVIMPGNPGNEKLIVCGKLYLPTGVRELVPDLAAYKDEFKKAGLEAGVNGPATVHRLMVEKSKHVLVNTDPLHPVCMLEINGRDAQSACRDYRAIENFTTGELTTEWSDAEGQWKRRLFVSRPDNIMVLRLEGPATKLACSLSLRVDHPQVVSEVTSSEDGWLALHNTYRKGKGGYDILARVVPSGGKMTRLEKGVKVEGADAILLILKVAEWRTPLPPEQSEAWSTSLQNPCFAGTISTNRLPELRNQLSALPLSYESLFAPHAKAHGELYRRVSLKLEDEANAALASEELLKKCAEQKVFPNAMAEQLYNACRYLIICSSGETPSNLQGIWTGTWSPAWSGDYTTDSNLQLEIQSLMSCNMPELMESYFMLIESWLPDWGLNARKVYGFRGLVSNARGSNNCLLLHWGTEWPGDQCAIGLAGWMLHFFYDYYLFTGDQKFLRERFLPIAKGIALFYEDFLEGTEGADGRYRFYMGYSPEHGLTANTTFDISTAKNVLTTLISACETLQCEAEKVKKWKDMLKKMPPYLINQAGELQEWSWPGTKESPNQRHHSHMLPLYQYCEFDKEETPELWKAADLAFRLKEANWLKNEKNPNSNHITHGLMNQGQCAARLGRGDIVHEILARMAIRRYLYPSFMISYWPNLRGFGFDPVGTTPDVINNALIFRWDDTLDVLPALPPAWTKGSVEGILLRGQLKVERMSWDRQAGAITLVLASPVNQTVTLRLPDGMVPTERLLDGKPLKDNRVALSAGKPNIVVLKLSERQQ